MLREKRKWNHMLNYNKKAEKNQMKQIKKLHSILFQYINNPSNINYWNIPINDRYYYNGLKKWELNISWLWVSHFKYRFCVFKSSREIYSMLTLTKIQVVSYVNLKQSRLRPRKIITDKEWHYGMIQGSFSKKI